MPVDIYLIDVSDISVDQMDQMDQKDNREDGLKHHLSEKTFRKITDDIREKSQQSQESRDSQTLKQLVHDLYRVPKDSQFKKWLMDEMEKASGASDGPSVKKSDLFEPIFNQIKAIIDGKNTQYSSDPIKELSVEDLLHQIKIKAIRAHLTNDPEKLEDELLDVITYSILTLKKISDEADEIESRNFT